MSVPAETPGVPYALLAVIAFYLTRSVSIPVNFLATSLNKFCTLCPLSADISKNIMSF